MEDGKILKLIYTFFLGLLLAVFVGVGIDSFYSPPAAPKLPVALNTYGKELTPEQADQQRVFDTRNEQYLEQLKPYNRNVSLLSLGAAIVFLVVSMIFQKRIRLLADGIMLGGLFTLLYSIGRGFASQNTKYVFTVVTLGLIIVLYLGFWRFARGPGVHANQSP